MATLSPRINEASIHSNAMTGSMLRQLREQLGISQRQLAPIVKLSNSSLCRMEAGNSAVPATVAAGVRAIQAAQAAGRIPNLPQKKVTWRKSVLFEKEPPFAALPANRTACGCGNPRCVLQPVRDGGWPNRGHLWIFRGWQCGKRVYLDASGQKVPPPRKVPKEVCSVCGCVRWLNGKDSKILGERVWILRCAPRLGDSPSLQHDPPTYWWKRNGRLERLPQDAIKKMHERSNRLLPVPTCDLPGCPGNGETMDRSSIAHHPPTKGGNVRSVLTDVVPQGPILSVGSCRAEKRRHVWVLADTAGRTARQKTLSKPCAERDPYAKIASCQVLSA